MPRVNKKSEIFSHLSQFGIFRDATGTFGSSTIATTAPAAGATAVTVAATTNFADGDWLRLGGGNEDVEIARQSGAPAGSDLNLRWPMLNAHAIGDAVVEQTLTDLGHVTDDGFDFTVSGSDEAVMSAIRRLAIGYLASHCEMTFRVVLEGYNLVNIATALGMLESAITAGAGTEASPEHLWLNPANFKGQNDLSFWAKGVRKDGKICALGLMGVELDWTQLTTKFARGVGGGQIPVVGRVTGGVFAQVYT